MINLIQNMKQIESDINMINQRIQNLKINFEDNVSFNKL